jgi:RND family efflux transporter MFP subunit
MNKLIASLMLTALVTCPLVISAQESEKAHLVSVEAAKTEQVNPTIWLPGNVISVMNTPISAEQTGQLLWIEEVGAVVVKGQRLAEIDHRDLKLQLAGQQAQVRQHQANVDYLAKQKKRMSLLSKKNNTALFELENIVKDLTIAENEVIALSLMVKQTELAIEKSHIVAPFSGSIVKRFAHVGELITAGRALVQLVDTNNLDINVAAPLTIAPFLQQDAKVMVKWQDKLFELPIRTWSLAGDPASRTFDVRLAAVGINLLPGSAVTVSLPKKSAGLATLVPRDALVLRERQTFVVAVDQQGKAKKVNVRVGQGIGRWISVSGDIWAGDNIIVRGAERVKDGQKVRIDEKLIVQTALVKQ